MNLMSTTDLFSLGLNPWKLTLLPDSQQFDEADFGQTSPEKKQVFVLDGRKCRTAVGFLREIHEKAGFITEGCSWNILNEGLHDLTWCKADAYLFVFTHADQLFTEAPGEWENLITLFDTLFLWQQKQISPVPRNILFVVNPQEELKFRTQLPSGLSPVLCPTS